MLRLSTKSSQTNLAMFGAPETISNQISPNVIINFYLSRITQDMHGQHGIVRDDCALSAGP